jgi:hypothetical protein
MENLRRKERDTSATVSKEGVQVVRIKLRHPLSRGRCRSQAPAGNPSEWLVVHDGYSGCGEASGSRVSFDAGWSYHRRSGSYLECVVGRGTRRDRLE